MITLRHILACLLMALLALPAQGQTAMRCATTAVALQRCPACGMAAKHLKSCCLAERAALATASAPCCTITRLPADPRFGTPQPPRLPDAAPLPIRLSLVPPTLPSAAVRTLPEDDVPQRIPRPDQGISPRGPPRAL